MSDRERLMKLDELAEIMRKGNSNADRVMLPSESQAIAVALEKEAIGLIEEITGVEWNFSFLCWSM